MLLMTSGYSQVKYVDGGDLALPALRELSRGLLGQDLSEVNHEAQLSHRISKFDLDNRNNA